MLEGIQSFDSLAGYQVDGPLAITDGGQAVRVSSPIAHRIISPCLMRRPFSAAFFKRARIVLAALIPSWFSAIASGSANIRRLRDISYDARIALRREPDGANCLRVDRPDAHGCCVSGMLGSARRATRLDPLEAVRQE
jgi:hypothetical protein